jgi:serine/threonine protein kinase
MGVVYKALDQDVVNGQRVGPIQVALKIVNSDKEGGTESVEALKNEGSVVFKLRHKNIVEMYSAERDGATWFLTMELLEGETVESIIARHPNGVALPESLPLIAQLCDGMSYAYNEHKIVHSDLKPSNVFVTRGRVVKIFDFGIASRVREIGEPETRFDPKRWGALTPAYACIEMWSGMSADPRDDVYSLGCIIYQVLCGRHPFLDENNLVSSHNRNLRLPARTARDSRRRRPCERPPIASVGCTAWASNPSRAATGSPMRPGHSQAISSRRRYAGTLFRGISRRPEIRALDQAYGHGSGQRVLQRSHA